MTAPIQGPSTVVGVDDPFEAIGTLELAAFTSAPNPFRGEKLEFRPGTAPLVSVEILDVRGRTARRVHPGLLPAGRNHLVWDGRDEEGRRLASGIYLARLCAAGATLVRRVVQVR